jgi:Microcystin-dependent protein
MNRNLSITAGVVRLDAKKGNVMKKFVAFVICQLSLLVCAPVFAAETLTVQGTLCDTKGVFLTGRQTVECRLYSQGEGGEALWGVAVATILDAQGVFTIELKDGAGSKLVDADLGNVLKATEKSELWLGVAVNGGGEMSPRQEIISVPFAIVGLDSSSAAELTVSGTARVDRMEVTESLSAGSLHFQRDFMVNGNAEIAGGLSVGGNMAVGAEVEAGRVEAKKGVFGAGAIPVGTIMPWWGSRNEVPEGWAICDGTVNGVPDLRGKFLYGCSNVTDVVSSGGSATVTLSQSNVPTHKHSITLKEPPKKDKGWPLNTKSNQEDFWRSDTVEKSADSNKIGGSGAHNNLPPYMKLYFIQRIW